MVCDKISQQCGRSLRKFKLLSPVVWNIYTILSLMKVWVLFTLKILTVCYWKVWQIKEICVCMLKVCDRLTIQLMSGNVQGSFHLAIYFNKVVKLAVSVFVTFVSAALFHIKVWTKYLVPVYCKTILQSRT